MFGGRLCHLRWLRVGLFPFADGRGHYRHEYGSGFNHFDALCTVCKKIEFLPVFAVTQGRAIFKNRKILSLETAR